MNKTCIALLLVLLPFSSNSNVLEDLKDTPATRYEVGKYKLEMYSYIITSKMKSHRIPNTKFEYKSTNIEDTENKLQIQATAEGRTKYLTQEQCLNVKSNIAKVFNTDELPLLMWDDLSEKQYKQLSSEISLKVILQAEENANFKIDC